MQQSILHRHCLLCDNNENFGVYLLDMDRDIRTNNIHTYIGVELGWEEEEVPLAELLRGEAPPPL